MKTLSVGNDYRRVRDRLSTVDLDKAGCKLGSCRKGRRLDDVHPTNFRPERVHKKFAEQGV
jgi:hypothetical protein